MLAEGGMAGRHALGKRVTLQTNRIDSTKLIRSCCCDLVWWRMDARAKAKVRVRKSIAKMEIVAMKGFENLGLGLGLQ